MIDLGSLKLGIKVDGEEAKKDLNNFEDKVKKASTTVKDKLGNAAKLAAKGVKVAAGACVAASAAVVALVESTREYREEQAKLQTSFESAGLSADAAKNTFTELNGILGDTGQATEAANHLAQLCDSEEQLAQWTEICAGVYGTFGDSIPIEGLTEAANETAKTGQLTGSLADALNWAGISEDEFQAKLDECSTEQERNKLITDTLTDTYKEAAEQYKITAADTIEANKANQKLQDSMAKLAETFEPLITDIKTFIAEGVSKLAAIVEQNQDKIDTFVDAIYKFGKFIIENADLITSLLVGIGVGLAVFNVASTVASLAAAMEGLTIAEIALAVAQGALNVVMNANPIVLIITLVAGLVAAIITLWKTNEQFRQSVLNVWNSIKTTVSNAINNCISFVKNAGSKMYEAGKEMFSNLWDGAKNVWNSITTWISEKIDWISEKFGKITGLFGGKDKDGSHRTGLREVPYDGYMAELHKGEMILTAAEAKRYQQGFNNSNDTVNNITVNNYSPKALSEAETARLYRKTQRELALGF